MKKLTKAEIQEAESKQLKRIYKLSWVGNPKPSTTNHGGMYRTISFENDKNGSSSVYVSSNCENKTEWDFLLKSKKGTSFTNLKRCSKQSKTTPWIELLDGDSIPMVVNEFTPNPIINPYEQTTA